MRARMMIPPGVRVLFMLAGALLALSLCVYSAQAQEPPPIDVGGRICFPSLLPLSGAESRAVNSEPALNADGERAVFWSTANPVGTNADRSVEVFLADTTNLTSTQPGFSPVSQVTQSNGNILGGFNLMPDVVTWVDGAGTPRTFVVLASDRDLVPGENLDGGFEIFLVQAGPNPIYYQLTKSSRSASLLPTVSDLFGGSFVSVAYLSDADANETRPAADNADRNAEVHVLTLNLALAGEKVVKNTQITRTAAQVINDQPAISGSGAQVVWLSSSTAGALKNEDGNRELFLARIVRGTGPAADAVTVLQVTATGAAVGNDRPDISETGSRIVFSSDATTLPGATNPSGSTAIFVANFASPSATTATFSRLTAPLKTVAGRNSTAKEPAITSDGGRIVFAADACDPNSSGACAQEEGVFQIFVAEERTTGGGQFVIAQVTTQFTRTFESPAISGDGGFIALVTSSEASRDNPDLSGSEVVLLECRISALAAQKEFVVVSPSISPERPDVGDTVDYLVSVDNSSLTYFDGVMTVTDTLPAGVTFVSSAIVAEPDQTTITLPPGPPNAQRNLKWTVNQLPAGERATVRIRVTVNSQQAGKELANLVVIASPTADDLVDEGQITFDKEDTATFFVTKVDLSARLDVSKFVPRPGEPFTYTVTLNNAAGMDPASGIVLTTTLPLLPFVPVSAIPSLGSYNAATGVWSIPQLDGGSAATLKLVMNAPAATGGQPPYSAEITSLRSDQEDVLASNNITFKTRTVRVLGTDLRLVRKTVNVARPPIGSNVVYTIMLRNRGPLPNNPTPPTDPTYVSNVAAFVPGTVTILDPLPAGLDFIKASDSGSFDGVNVVWEVPGWSTAITRTLFFTAQVTAAPETTVVNRVGSVEARFPLPDNALMSDPVPANNAPNDIFAQFTVNSPADVAVSVQGLPAAVFEGSLVQATVRYTDADQLDTHDLVLDWGDGSLPAVLNDIARPTGQLFFTRTFTHTYADDDDDDFYTVIATVSDSFNQSGSANATVTVVNVEPTPGAATVTQFARRFGSAYVVMRNTPLRVSVPFSDPGFTRDGRLESFFTVADWGDGIIDDLPVQATNVVTGSPGVRTTGVAAVQHAYTTYGTTVAQFYLRDDDMPPDGVPAATFDVIVNDPPLATPDVLTVQENGSGSVNVLANDQALGDGDTITVQRVITTGTLGTVLGNFNPATGVITYTTGSAFESLNVGQTGTDRFQYVVVDQVGFTRTSTVTVTVQGVNDPPVLDLNGAGAGINTTATFIEDTGSVQLAPALTLADVDSPLLAEVRVQLSVISNVGQEILLIGSTSPSITAVYTPTTGMMIITGPASPATFRTVLATLRYDNLSQSPTDGPRTVRYRAFDTQGAGSALADVALSVQATDDPPVVTTSAGNTGVTEGALVAVQVDAAITITDVDTAIFNGGALTATVQTPDATLDNLTILTGGGISLSGTTVSFNATSIGTAAGLDTPQLVITLNGGASVAAVQALARQIAYDRDSGVSPATRVVAFSARSSAAGGVSNTATKTIAVASSNDPPIVTVTPIAAVEDTLVEFSGNYTIADLDAGNGSLVATFSVFSGVLGYQGAGTFTGNGTAQVSVTGTLAQLNAAANTFYYSPTLNFFGNDMLSISVNDQGNSPPPAQIGPGNATITVAPVNDVPTLDLDTTAGGTGFSATFVEDGAAVSIAGATLDINDVDGPNVLSATVRISNLINPGLETLSATSPNPNITLSYNAAIGVLSVGVVNINNPQPMTDFEAVLRSITYSNSSQNPTTTARLVTFVVEDPAGANSNTATSTVNMQVNNDPPMILLDPAPAAAQESAAAIIIDVTSVVSDLESTVLNGGAITLTVVGGTAEDKLDVQAGGTGNPITITGGAGTLVRYNGTAFVSALGRGTAQLRLTGMNENASLEALTALLQHVTYQRTAGVTIASRTVNYVIREAGLQTPGLATKTINITQFNDPPVVTIAAFAPAEDTALSIGGFITVNDPDALAGTLVMTASVTNGRITVNTALPVTGNSTNRVVVQGTLPDLQALLATPGDVVYQGNLNHTGADQLIVTVNDQGNTPFPAKTGSATRDFTVSSVNDAPVIALTPFSALEDTNFSLNGRVVFTDVDALTGQMAVTMSVTTGTLDVTAVTGVTGLTGDNSALVRFAGNQTALRSQFSTVNGILYRGITDFSGNGTLGMQIGDQGNTPAPALVGQQTTPFTVTAVNDTPTLGVNTGITITQAVAPAGPVTTTLTSASLTFNDVDNSAAEIVYTVVATPAVGVVQLSGVNRAACAVNLATATFTQEDINQNRMRYIFNSAVRPIDGTLTLVVGNAANCAAAQVTYPIRVRAP